jgi:hypothetical protein
MKKYTNKQRRFLKFFVTAYHITRNAKKSKEIACELTGYSEKLGKRYCAEFAKNNHKWTDLKEGGDLGYVYLIKEKGTLNHKIGCTKSIESRFRTLQIGNPRELEIKISCFTYFYRQLERVLHHLFAEQKIRSEWFVLLFSDFKMLKERTDSMPITYERNS